MSKVKNLKAAKQQAFALVRRSPEYGRAIRGMDYHDRRQFDKNIMEKIDANAEANMSFIEKHPLATGTLALLLVGGTGYLAITKVAIPIAQGTIDVIAGIPDMIPDIHIDPDCADIGLDMINALGGIGVDLIQ